MPKIKVNSPVFVYNDSHLSLKVLCVDTQASNMLKETKKHKAKYASKDAYYIYFEIRGPCTLLPFSSYNSEKDKLYRHEREK